ncbi:MAG: hypothetical protein WBQ25_13835 [Nitrososphaeraceae archaeon]
MLPSVNYFIFEIIPYLDWYLILLLIVHEGQKAQQQLPPLPVPRQQQPQPQPQQLDVQNKSLRWPNIRTEYVLILFLLKPLG